MSRYRRIWTASVDYIQLCADCGVPVLDPVAHDLWHAAQADIWDWISRVSGDSCNTARAVFDDGEQKG